MCDYEAELRYSQIQSVGVIKEIQLDPSRFYLDGTGGSLSAGVSTSAPVGLTKFVTNSLFRAISFHASADETALISATIPIPLDFRNQEANRGRKPSMELWLRARKSIVTGTPTDNDDLALDLMGHVQSPTLDPKSGAESAGGAILTTIAGQAVMPAQSALTTLAGARLIKFDLLNGLTDAERMLVAPGGTLAFRIGPNEAVGTDLRLDLWDFRIVYVGHLNPPQWVDNEVQA